MSVGHWWDDTDGRNKKIGLNLSQRHSVHHICGYSPASANILVLLLTWLGLKTNGSCTLILTSDTVAVWQGRGVKWETLPLNIHDTNCSHLTFHDCNLNQISCTGFQCGKVWDLCGPRFPDRRYCTGTMSSSKPSWIASRCVNAIIANLLKI